MLHEFREIPLITIWSMKDEDFLQACNDYLDAALAEDKRMANDVLARQYLREVPELGISDDELNYYDG